MVSSYVAEFRRGVSRARIAPYDALTPTLFDAAVAYHWNIALSEALYPTLAAFEIVLRNSIHDTLTDHQNGDEYWFRHLLEPTQLREYANAHARLISDGVSHPPAGKIIAELKFWFWTSLLSELYDASLWRPNRTALLKAAFPFLPRVPNNRHYVSVRCNDIRQLRNRVMHHEPIWKGMSFQRKGNLRESCGLDEMHDRITEAIGWINPTVQRSISELDRFDDVFIRGRQTIESNLRTEFNLP